MSAKMALLPVVVLLLLVAFATPASAQTGIVKATVQLVPEDFPKANDDGLPHGESTFGFVGIKFCWGQGSFNPNQGKFIFTLKVVGSSEWVQVSDPGDAAFEYTPPIDPRTTAGCTDTQIKRWQISATISHDAPNATTGEVRYGLEVSGDTEAGTYGRPDAPAEVVAKIKTVDPEDDPLASLPPAGGSTTPVGGGGTETSEGPAPVAPLTALIMLALIATLRRRR